MDPFDFTGRHVFVAGGTSGINLCIAEGFATRGGRLTVISRSPERVAGAVKGLQAHGAEALGFSADVRDPAAVNAALAGAHQQFGEIDVLVSGAAGNFPAPALGMSPNGFKAVIDIDLIGTFNVLRGAHAFLRKPGASIINISAPQSVHATPLQAHVCAAKAGLDMLTRVLCLEWGPDGIRVNSIIPGGISDTEGMARLAPTPEAKETFRSVVPLGRFGTKADVANLALFLASPLASYISGAVIPVDGGRTANGDPGLGRVLAAARQ